MKLLSLLFTIFLFLATPHLFAGEIYGQGNDGKMMIVEGYISEEPRFHSGYNGQYQSWTFRMNAAPDHRHGDEFILVTVHTVKWGKTVGTFSGHKGDKIKLNGRYSEFKSNQKGTGIVGSLYVNDLSIKEVKGK